MDGKPIRLGGRISEGMSSGHFIREALFGEGLMAVSVEYLKQRYSYNPETGEITNRKTGKVGRTKRTDGRTSYFVIAVKRRPVFAHRAAWALHYGEWPNGQIDHIDRDGTNNRISNLRVVDWVQNARNQRPPVTSKSGVCGVIWVRHKKKWRAQIGVGGKQICLGYYKEVELAVSARKAGEEKYWRTT